MRSATADWREDVHAPEDQTPPLDLFKSPEAQRSNAVDVE